MLERITAPIRRRLKLLISRAVGRMVDPTAMLQTMQVEVLKGELLDNVEHLEGYGRTAHPPKGFEVLVASLGGDRAHTVALAACHRGTRVKGLKAGEQAIYDDQGQVIALLRDKIIHIYGCNKLVAEAGVEAEITCPKVTVVASEKVRFETPLFECTGNIMDNCDTNGVDMGGMRQVYNNHVHPENDNGGPTDVPATQMV